MPESGLERQFIPRKGDNVTLPGELDDPLGDQIHSPGPRLVHHYPDRLLVLTTDRCFRYCRFCFRKHWTGKGITGFNIEDRIRLTDYLNAHKEIREVIFSGGDVLTLDDQNLISLVHEVRALGKIIRISTRVASLAPHRLTQGLCRGLGQDGGVWWIHHVNHPDELHEGFRHSVKNLHLGLIGQVSQSVMLSGISDDAEVLLELFTSLMEIGVKPYYLFFPDLASGTSAWRLNLEDALEVWHGVKARASRLVLPTFAVDLPGGRGKVEVESHLLRSSREGWYFRAPDGGEVLYPRLEAELSKTLST